MRISIRLRSLITALFSSAMLVALMPTAEAQVWKPRNKPKPAAAGNKNRGQYPGGVTVTDAQLATVRLERHRFHGDWNYTIHPAKPRPSKSVIF